MKNDRLLNEFLEKVRNAFDLFLDSCLHDYLSPDEIIKLGAPFSDLPEGQEVEYFSEGLFLIYRMEELRKDIVVRSSDLYAKVERIFELSYQKKILRGLEKASFENTVNRFWSLKHGLFLGLAEDDLTIEIFQNIAEELIKNILPAIKNDPATLMLLGLIVWEVATHGFQEGGIEF